MVKLNLYLSYSIALCLLVTSADAGFFDPHNHLNGVIKSSDYAHLEKVVRGEAPTTRELAQLWGVLRGFFDESYSKEPRYAIGAYNTLLCNEPETYHMRAHYEQSTYRALLEKNIERLLSATPITGFDSAYAHRSRLKKEYTKNMRGSDEARIKNTIRRAVLYRLAEDRISFVEMTTNFVGGDKNGSRMKDLHDFDSLLTDLHGKNPKPENAALKNILEKKKWPIPKISWLLMMHTSELGTVDENNKHAILDYRSGSCAKEEQNTKLMTDPEEPLYNALVDNLSVVGTDIAGIETTCFTKAGMKWLEKQIVTVYRASRERHFKKQSNVKMLVRVHVGEGAPIIQWKRGKNKPEACGLLEKIEHEKTMPGKKPEHLVQGEKNIDAVIGLIGQLKERIPDIDKFVVFRLGHATSVSLTQAKIIKALNIEVDVNLSSNIATGSWPVSEQVYEAYIGKHAVPTNMLSSLLAGDLQRAIMLFQGHALKSLLYQGVTVILGSDASGVEHSNMIRDYDIAHLLIKHWNNTDKKFKRRGITINTLLNNQMIHVKSMNYEKLIL